LDKIVGVADSINFLQQILQNIHVIMHFTFIVAKEESDIEIRTRKKLNVHSICYGWCTILPEKEMSVSFL
jgi:hypothetical protein